jgi:iron complex outermembrane receptor protein
VGVAALSGAAQAQDHPQSSVETRLREVEVVAPTPLPGSSIARDKLPTTIETLTDQDVVRSGSLAITEALQQRAPGISLSDSQGAAFAQDLDFRGLHASPLEGASQGVAIYMNGVRLNEAFGDTVNWDLIPATAIARADVFAGNSAFGLNALGGSVSIRMKSGFDWTGGRVSVEGGSFGKAAASAQFGARRDGWSAYLAADGGREDGWRAQSGADIARLYGDIGWKGEKVELHLFATGASNRLGVVGPTPADLLAHDPAAIYTFPQSTRNLEGLVGLSAEAKLASGWSVEAGAHFRAFDQHHLDGNGGDFTGCAFDPGLLCAQSDAFPPGLGPPPSAFQVLNASGAPIGCPTGQGGFFSCDQVPYGTLDRTSAHARTVGASIQATSRASLLRRSNLFAVGADVERSVAHFASDSTLGVIGPDLGVSTAAGIPGSGEVIATRAEVGYGPIELRTRITTYGLYATDSLDVTDRLSVTASARLNLARIALQDLLGSSPGLNGSHSFSRLDPSVGAVYRVGSGASIYGQYAEANRAPTPLELGCSDPAKPCLLQNALVADPPLKQVAAHSWEAGVRGSPRLGRARLDWRISVFRTDLSDDILALASPIQGRGYYANVPGTRREGVEAQVDIRRDGALVYLGFSHIEATYRFAGALPSPNNPSADPSGDVHVVPGSHIGGSPENRFKAGLVLEPSSRMTFGADIVAVGAQWLVGDEANRNPKLEGYWTADIHAAYALPAGFEIFGRIDNLFDRRFSTFGTYFSPDGVALIMPPVLPPNPDPRAFTLAPPRAFTIGLRRAW